MKRLVLILIALFFISPIAVFADNTITRNDLLQFDELTTVQKAELVKQIAELSEANELSGTVQEAVKDTSVEDISEWADVGTKYGKMLVGIAKELGIAANEFARTPLGIISVGLIVWHVAGPDLLGIILGLLWFAVTIPIWTWLFFKVCYPVAEWKEVRKVSWGKEYVVDKSIRKFRAGSGSGTPEGIIFPSALAFIVLIGIVFIA